MILPLMIELQGYIMCCGLPHFGQFEAVPPIYTSYLPPIWNPMMFSSTLYTNYPYNEPILV